MFTNVWALLTLMIEQDFVNFVRTPLYPSLLSCKVPSWHSQLYFVTNLQDKLHRCYICLFFKLCHQIHQDFLSLCYPALLNLNRI